MKTLRELKHQLYDATSQGLDIILDYIPEARKCLINGNITTKKFKIRAENTASAQLYAPNSYCNACHIVDYGDDSKVKAPITIAAEHEHCMYNQAILILCERYNITDNNMSELKPRLEFRKLESDENSKSSSIRLSNSMPRVALEILAPNLLKEHAEALN